MAQTLATNINNLPFAAFNDIYLDGQGNIAIAVDLQATLQACSQAARTLLGEMIFNINQGIPYFQTVWIGVPNIPQFTAALRISILAVPGVVEIVSLLTSQVNNTLTYNAIIRTIYGSGSING